MRSYRETSIETSALCLLFVVVMLVLAFAFAGEAVPLWENESIISAGNVLFDQLGWVLTVYITVLLGFYAASLGRQFYSDQQLADKSRNELGFAAEMMTAAAATMIVFIALGSFNRPERFGMIIVVVPTFCLVFFLATNLGRFVVVGKESASRLHGDLSKVVARSRGLGRGARGRPLLVIVGNVLFITAAAALPAFKEPAQVPGVLLFNLIPTTVLVGAYVYARYNFLTEFYAVVRWGSWIFPLFVVLSLVMTVAVALLGEISMPWEIILALVLIMVSVSVSTFIYSRREKSRIPNWSLNGAVNALARKSLVEARVRISGEINDLEDLLGSNVEAKQVAERVPVSVGCCSCSSQGEAIEHLQSQLEGRELRNTKTRRMVAVGCAVSVGAFLGWRGGTRQRRL